MTKVTKVTFESAHHTWLTVTTVYVQCANAGYSYQSVRQPDFTVNIIPNRKLVNGGCLYYLLLEVQSSPAVKHYEIFLLRAAATSSNIYQISPAPYCPLTVP